MSLKKLIKLELISALLLSLAIPNQFLLLGSFVCGLAALIPHFIALEKAKNLKQTLLLCFIQSLCVHLLSSVWLSYFKDFAYFTYGASGLGTATIHMFFGFFFYLPKIIRTDDLYFESPFRRFINSNTFKVIWFSCVYTVWEFQKSHGFLAYPWGTIPMSCYNLKLVSQITDTTGVRGITFLFSFFAANIGVFCIDFVNSNGKKSYRKNFNIFSATLLFFMTATVYGLIQYSIERVPVKHMNTILVQQNYNPWVIPDDALNIYESEALTLKGAEDFKKQGKKPDLVVWSEGVLHYPFPNGSESHYRFFPEQSAQNPELRPLIPFLRDIDAVTVIGGPYCHNMEELKFSNAALLFGRDGLYKDYYAKIHLVPFAEYIPFTDNPIMAFFMNSLVGFAVGWVPGNEFKAFPVELSDYPGQNVSISMPICFEDAFGDIFAGLKKAGTEVFVNITDDSWSCSDAAEYQHFIIAWFRAIEFRTTLLRSTNSGYTIVEDPAGRILYDLPLFESTYMAVPVPVYENFLTFYAIFGEWLSGLCIIFIILTAICLFKAFHDRYMSVKPLILKELYKISF